MRDMLIGPGQPCHVCGEVYSRHADGCAEVERRRVIRKREDRALGREIREAITDEDDLELVRLLREVMK